MANLNYDLFTEASQKTEHIIKIALLEEKYISSLIL